eukprot:CAMPEP_0175142738 /NCGR_PEP_ID=MMETSP0087-20121206/12994_1 /TAXON_ID=136419 /ORGANISM="Unknown Unknown, Strain D1" /LENGTH=240 /DNA_ID=CAMNT_0016426631 /DNA_START=52 /DNA_END=775 /DNA_ORIENTATION=+
MSSLVCTSCEIQIDVSDRNAHYRCEWHRYNVKRRVAGLQPIPEQLFNQKLAALRTMQDGEKESQQAQTCTICCKTFNSASAFEKHLASKRHQSRAASRSSRASRKTSTNSTASSLASSSSPAPATQQQPELCGACGCSSEEEALGGDEPSRGADNDDGAIIGHRALNRAYKQNVRPVTRQEEIWALMGDYRKLTLDGYNKRRPETFNQFQHKYQQRRVREQNKYMFRANNIKHFVDATES